MIGNSLEKLHCKRSRAGIRLSISQSVTTAAAKGEVAKKGACSSPKRKPTDFGSYAILDSWGVS